MFFSSPVLRLWERLLESRGGRAALLVRAWSCWGCGEGEEEPVGQAGQVSSSKVEGPVGPRPRRCGLWQERS